MARTVSIIYIACGLYSLESSFAVAQSEIILSRRFGEVRPFARNFLDEFRNCTSHLMLFPSFEQKLDKYQTRITRFLVQRTSSFLTIYNASWLLDIDNEATLDSGEAEKAKYFADVTQITKHSACKIHVYVTSGSGKFLVGRVAWFAEKYALIHRRREDPGFIIIFINDKQTSNTMYIPLGLWTVSTTATFITVTNEKSAALLCAHCGMEKNASRAIMLTNTKLETIKRVSDGVHGNLRNYFVNVYSPQRVVKICETGPWVIRTRPVVCTLSMLGEKYNFTPRFQNKLLRRYTIPSDYVSIVITGMYMSKELASLVANPKKIRFMRWAPSGERLSYYPILLVQDAEVGNLHALWDALDGSSAVLSFLCTIAVASVVTRYITQEGGINYIKRCCSLALTLGGFLVERNHFPKSGRPCCGFNARNSALVSLWALTAIVLSNSFKGAIFSALTTTKPPEVPPADIHHLAKYPGKILTTTTFIDANNKKVSLLHSTLVDFSKFLGERVTPSASTDQLINAANSLRDKLIFVNASVPEVVFKLVGDSTTEFLLREGFKGKYPDFLWPRYVSVDEEHIFIGEEKTVKLYMMMLAAFENKKISTKGTPVNSLTLRSPYLIHNNFFASNFINGLFRLEESGIAAMWASLNKDVWNAHSFQQLAALEEARGGKGRRESKKSRKIFSRKKNVMANLLDGEGTAALVAANDQKSRMQLSLKVVRIVPETYAIGMLGSVLCFLVEYYWTWKSTRIGRVIKSNVI